MATFDWDPNEDEGFLALLGPIKELVKDGDYDFSQQINLYLQHIHNIREDRMPEMNFAQAAVIVQNSTGIYSAKIDKLCADALLLEDSVTRIICASGDGARGEREGEEGSQNPASRRRKPQNMFDADEFNLIEDAYTDRNITLNLEKEYQKNMERKKQSIVITPPLKTTTQNNEKDKKKIFCEFYNHKDQPMGKKEEFRLNWRLSSQGILHEEYVVNKNAFALLEPVEITVIENNIDSGDDADHHYDDDMPADVGLLQDDDNIISDSASLISVQPPTSERESDAGICRHNRDGYRAEKPLHEIQPWNSDTRLQEWEPNDFNNVLEDRPIRRRNTAKVPPELDVNQNKRKQAGRGGFELFTITDILINPKNESSETFGKDSDFSFQAKKILKEKKRRLQQHRLKFKGVLEFEDDAGSDIDNDFVGFDGQDDGELDEPVNEPDIISSQGNQNWNGDCPESYENTAKSCMQVFNKKKREEFGKLTPEMAVRVADWHRKVIPLLDAAEERSSFNMADYGTKILTHFGNRIGTTKKFEEIVANEPQQEVSRYFLSMLLLANQNNVEISNTSTEMLPTDCISLKLLSTVRHHEQLDENMQLTTARQD